MSIEMVGWIEVLETDLAILHAGKDYNLSCDSRISVTKLVSVDCRAQRWKRQCGGGCLERAGKMSPWSEIDSPESSILLCCDE